MGKYTLIVIGGFGVAFGMLQNNINETNDLFVDQFLGRYRQAHARSIATSGIGLALSQLVNDGTWRAGYSNLPIADGFLDVTLEDTSIDPTLKLNQVRVIAEGSSGGATSTSTVLWKRTAFSEYAYFTKIEPVIYFIGGDTIRGPAHTNGQFHMSGKPAFMGKVTSPNMWTGINSPDPQFLAGSDFNHPKVKLPIDMVQLKDAGNNGGIHFKPGVNKAVWLDFLPDGTVNWVFLKDWKSPNGSTAWNNLDLSTINGVILSKEEVHVQGTLNGQVTLWAKKDVYIEDDIVYKDNPANGPSDDLMGIISKKNIIVVDNAANSSDVVIHASLMAHKGEFTVENYNVPPMRGTLNILGGVIQKTRGPVGTFSGQTSYSGYSKDYQYDDRFKDDLPPFFPIAGDNAGGSYAPGTILSWQE